MKKTRRRNCAHNGLHIQQRTRGTRQSPIGDTYTNKRHMQQRSPDNMVLQSPSYHVCGFSLPGTPKARETHARPKWGSDCRGVRTRRVRSTMEDRHIPLCFMVELNLGIQERKDAHRRHDAAARARLYHHVPRLEVQTEYDDTLVEVLWH